MKHLTNATVQQIICDYLTYSTTNNIAEEVALSPELEQMPIFKEPLMAFGATTDELFRNSL